MPTTEIVTCPLKPGSDIGDPDNHAAKVLKDIATTLSQQDGFQQVQFGMQIENPDTIQLMIDWDSLDAHKKFMSSTQYKPFFDSFASIIAAAPTIVHADLQPSGALNETLSAPVTEIATFYFDGSEPSDYVSGVDNFRSIMEKDGAEHGYVASALGITHESELEKEGKKGKAAVLTIGWQSVDAHHKFREHEVFQSNIGSLRNGAIGADMVHVKFLPFVPDA